MTPNPLNKVKIYEFPQICDPRGNLSFIEEGHHVIFPIRRVFYIYDIPGGASRGAHANRRNAEMLIAVTGSLDLHLSDGSQEIVVTLNRSNKGVLIPPGAWVSMHNFTSGTICLALCSELYDEDDYIRDFKEYLEYAKSFSAE